MKGPSNSRKTPAKPAPVRAKGRVPPWKAYQHETADFFKTLGCIVETDASIQGVRARHAIDVWVRFARFGVQVAWVIECKLWKRRVPKEKVLALKAVVEDIGADRGILLAESGHQRGARVAARSTNVTLATLEDLRHSANLEQERSLPQAPRPRCHVNYARSTTRSCSRHGSSAKGSSQML